MKKAEQPAKESKLALLDLLIEFSERGSRSKEEFLELVEKILSFNQDALNPSACFMVSPRDIVFYGLLGIQADEVDAYLRGTEKYVSPLFALREEVKNEGQDSNAIKSFYHKCLEKFVISSDSEQNLHYIERLLELLLKYKCYEEIIELFRYRLNDSTRAKMKEFYMKHLDDSRMLASSPQLLSYFKWDAADVSCVMTALQARGDLRACGTQDQCDARTRDCRAFFHECAKQQLKAPLNASVLQQFLELLKNLKEINNRSLITIYLGFGFNELSGSLLPVMLMEDRMTLLNDDQFFIQPEQVNEALKGEKNPSREYLDAWAKRVVQDRKTVHINPSRPKQLALHIMRDRQGDTWDAATQDLFVATLVHPVSQIDRISQCTNVAALLAIFEECYFFPATRDMYMVRRPVETVNFYRVTSAEKERIVYNQKCTLEYAGLDKLKEKDVVFAQCCGTLASNMTAEQAEGLLRFLISDETLHPLIPKLLDQPKTCVGTLKGYLPVYLELILNPDADKKLVDMIKKIGGSLLGVMSVEQCSAVFDQLIGAEQFEELTIILRSADDSVLSELVARRLLILFIDEAAKNPRLKAALYKSEVFDMYVALLFSLMKDEQRLAVLRDSKVTITLDLIKELMPERGESLVGSAECVDVLVLRAASGRVLDYLVNSLEKREGAIVRLFTETITGTTRVVHVQDGAQGVSVEDRTKDEDAHDKLLRSALSGVLLNTYFMRFFAYLVSHSSRLFVDNPLNTQIDGFIHQLILTAPTESPRADVLSEIIKAVVVGSNNKDEKYLRLANRLFAKDEFCQCLFSAKTSEKVSLFVSVVDTLVEVEDTTLLEPLLKFIMNNPGRAEDLILFLHAAIGIRAIALKTNETRPEAFVRLRIIADILNYKPMPKEYAEKIRSVGADFILRCAQHPESAFADALEYFVKFGCRPVAALARGESSEVDHVDLVKADARNPYHLAVVYKGKHFDQLIPTLQRIPVYLLRLYLFYDQFDRGVFERLLQRAFVLDPQYLQDAALPVLMRQCVRDVIGVEDNQKAKLYLFKKLVALGVMPSLENFELCVNKTRHLKLSDAELFEFMLSYAPDVLLVYAKKRLVEVEEKVKHELVGKLEKIAKLELGKAEEFSKLMTEILEFNMDPIVVRTLFLGVTQKQAMLLLLGLDSENSLREKDPFYEPVQNTKTNTTFCEHLPNAIFDGNKEQNRALLELLLHYKLYAQILRIFTTISNLKKYYEKDSNREMAGKFAEKMAQAIDFYFAHMSEDPTLFAMGGQLLFDLTEEQAGRVLQALEHFCGSAANGVQGAEDIVGGAPRICATFMALLANRQSELKDLTLKQLLEQLLLDLFRRLSQDKSLAEVYVEYGFATLSVVLLPLMNEAERLAVLKDPRVSLTTAQVELILAAEEKPSKEYLNALTVRVTYDTEVATLRAARPQSIIKGLVSCYQADAWGDKVKEHFCAVLDNPMGGTHNLEYIGSVPALLDLFEQLYLVPQTREMCFLRRPAQVINGVLAALTKNSGIYFGNSPVQFRGVSLCDYKDVSDKSTSKVKDKPIPFDACCRLLGVNMDTAQAERLFRFLMVDKDLHARIKPLLEASRSNDAALLGFVKPYLEVMKAPEKYADLITMISSFGGVLLEQMSKAEFSELVRSVNTLERRAELGEILLRTCRTLAKNKGVVKALSSLIVEEVQRDSDLKRVLYPGVLTHLCGLIMPVITDEQRKAVLSDKDTAISLPLVQTLLPIGADSPVILNRDCVGIIMLRSVSEDPKVEAFHHLMSYFFHKKEDIYALLIDCVENEDLGEKVRDILMREYFLRYLALLVKHININDVKAKETVRVVDLVSTLSLKQNAHTIFLPELVKTFVTGCFGEADADQFKFMTKIILADAAVQEGLFIPRGKGPVLFTEVVDQLAQLPLDYLESLIGYIKSTPSLVSYRNILLYAANGNRTILTNTNDMNRDAHTNNYRPDIVGLILTGEPRTSLKSVVDLGPALINGCCRTKRPAAAVNLELFLDFGFRPNPEHWRGVAVNEDLNDPFQMVAALGDMRFLKALMPHINRVPLIVFRQLLKHDSLTAENFRFLLTSAKAKDPNFVKDSDLKTLYESFVFGGLVSPSREAVLNEVVIALAAEGIEPPENVLAVLRRRDKEESFGKALAAVRKHTPNALVLYATKANDAELVCAVFEEHRATGKLVHFALGSILAWAFIHKPSPEFIGLLIDRMMPELSGADVVSIVRGLAKLSQKRNDSVHFGGTLQSFLEKEAVNTLLFERHLAVEALFTELVLELVESPWECLFALIGKAIEDQVFVIELLSAGLGLRTTRPDARQWTFTGARNLIRADIVEDVLERCSTVSSQKAILFHAPTLINRCRQLSEDPSSKAKAIMVLEFFWTFFERIKALGRLDKATLEMIGECFGECEQTQELSKLIRQRAREETVIEICQGISAQNLVVNVDAPEEVTFGRRIANIRKLLNFKQMIMDNKVCPALIVETFITVIKDQRFDERLVNELLHAFGLQRLFLLEPYKKPAKRGFFGGLWADLSESGTVRYSLNAAEAYLCIVRGVEPNHSKELQTAVSAMMGTFKEDSCLPEFLWTNEFYQGIRTIAENRERVVEEGPGLF